MKLQNLVPNPRNPRKISDKKLEMLKKSLAEFGDLSGIVFNKQTGHLVGGHQRIKALPSDTEIVMDTETHGHVLINGERFSYRIVDWDEIKEKAANIAANKHGGEFDIPILNDWLLDLDAANFDMDLTGFDSEEIENLMAPITKVEGLCDEDEVPEPKESIAKRGDIWQLGNHRLMCGDSTSIDDVEKLMDGGKADMTFTSPPYNAGISSKLTGNTSVDDNFYGDGYDDNKDEGEYLGFLSSCTILALKYSRYVFWNVQFLAGNRTALPAYWSAFKEYICDVAIWDKGHAAPQRAARVLNSVFEFIFIFTSDENPNRAIRISPEFRGTIDNIFRIPPQRANEYANVHAATFPVSFPESFIDNFCPKKGSVLDLFGGTGTTLIAAEKKGIRSYLMEIDPRYCDLIIARWEKFTGKKATLLTEPNQVGING